MAVNHRSQAGQNQNEYVVVGDPVTVKGYTAEVTAVWWTDDGQKRVACESGEAGRTFRVDAEDVTVDDRSERVDFVPSEGDRATTHVTRRRDEDDQTGYGAVVEGVVTQVRVNPYGMGQVLVTVQTETDGEVTELLSNVTVVETAEADDEDDETEQATLETFTATDGDDDYTYVRCPDCGTESADREFVESRVCCDLTDSPNAGLPLVTDGGEPTPDEFLSGEAAETNNSPTGCELHELNAAGGGDSIPDDCRDFSRPAWTDESDGDRRNVWANLARLNDADFRQENGFRALDDGEQVVFGKTFGWFLNFDRNEDLRAAFGRATGWDGHNGATRFYAVRHAGKEKSDSKAYCLTELAPADDVGRWSKPPNKYGMAWLSRSCATLYELEGDATPTDMENLRRRDALPEDMDAWDAEADDYDYGLALSAAHRRATDGAQDDFAAAWDELEELPEVMQQRAKVGFRDYMSQRIAAGDNLSKDEAAPVVNALVAALSKDATAVYDDKIAPAESDADDE